MSKAVLDVSMFPPRHVNELTDEQRLGLPDDYCCHVLYVEPDGSFSIVALVWRPGQVTRIHDHVTWGAFGVIQGVEHEELFDIGLNLAGRNENRVGDVSGFAPPGDIHRVRTTQPACPALAHVWGLSWGLSGDQPTVRFSVLRAPFSGEAAPAQRLA